MASDHVSLDIPAKYPPVCRIQVIGYLHDTNGIEYSRDIGRSFQLGNQIYYIFGDTFCKNQEGDYVGIQSNTVAIVNDREMPHLTSYLCIRDDGIVEPLLPLNPEEVQFQEENDNVRFTLWGFGGVVEVSDGVGLLWYQKGIYRQNDQSHEYLGIGLAKITLNKATGILSSYRCPGLLFKANEPLVGSFSCIVNGPYIYLYGKIETRMIIARVYKGVADRRQAYTFFDGTSWVHDWRRASTLFREMYQGGIVRSELFGKDKQWVLIGNNKWVDNKIQVGASMNLEGPWQITPVAEAKGIEHGNNGGMYCMYPHAWALEQDKRAELMVTWSEYWPGGVVAAKLIFDTEQVVNGDRTEL